MKASHYTSVYALESRDKEKLIFNARTLALALIENDKLDSYNAFCANGTPIQDEKLLSDLKTGGFLLEDDVDEEAIIRHEQLSARYNTNQLSLVLAPTSNCNFRCVYCYERPVLRCSKMDEETQEAIVNYVKSVATHLDQLFITWYGGEPLLALDVIEALSKQFIDICEEHHINYGASIVTNGYLLNRDVVKKLNELRVHRYQITLDGKKEIHDVNRPLANGGGTFDVITKNLIDVKDIIPSVSLRINTGKHNVNDVQDIYKWVSENGLEEKVSPYLGKITSSGNDDPTTSMCLTTDEFVLARINLVKQGIDTAAGTFTFYPNPVRCYCGADNNSVYVIDSDGSLYKCWDDIGHKDLAVGNIKEGLNYSPTFFAYMQYSALDDDDCKNCPALPLCMGGCPHRRLFKLPDRCSEFKDHLKEFLLITAERILEQRRQQKHDVAQ